jgi:hypothetical protein
LVRKFVHETAITKAITKKLTREEEKLEFEEANGCDVIVNVLGSGGSCCDESSAWTYSGRIGLRSMVKAVK